MRFRVAVALGFCANLGACDSGTPPGADETTFTVVDSGGVEIVQSQRPSWTESERWTVDTLPTLVIGDDENDPGSIIGRANAAFVSADGSVVIADGLSREFRVFDSEGRLRSTFGRDGDGPGEYRSFRWIHRASGDTVVVWDSGLGRSTRVTLSGDFISTRTITEPFPDEWLLSGRDHPHRVFPILATGRGEVIAHPIFLTSRAMNGPSGVVQDTLPLAVYPTDGAERSVLLTVRHTQNLIHDRTSGLAPFGERFYMDTFDDRIAIHWGKPPEIRLWNLQGAPVRIIRWPGLSREVTEEAMQGYEDAFAGRFAEASQADVRVWVRSMPVPQWIPDSDRVLWDRVGNLWTRRYIPPHLRDETSSRSWDIFDTRGVWLGTVELPLRYVVNEIGSDYVLATVPTDLDVETVQRFRLNKRSSN